MNNELREELARVSHEICSHWMKYMYRKANFTKTGAAFWKVEDIQHWKRQMELPYYGLTEKEKDIDREQADKIIKVFEDQIDRVVSRS